MKQKALVIIGEIIIDSDRECSDDCQFLGWTDRLTHAFCMLIPSASPYSGERIYGHFERLKKEENKLGEIIALRSVTCKKRAIGIRGNEK